MQQLRETLFPILQEVEVIGLDEAQWLDESVISLASELVHFGKRVIVAGLDMTFAAEFFGYVPALMSLADEVTKPAAVCTVCSAPAIHSQRLGQSRELVLVGAAGVYEARCRRCFVPYADETGSQQLELPSLTEDIAAL